MKQLVTRNKGATLDDSHAVRATFSLPSRAMDDIEELRRIMGKRGILLNRSELIRLGLAALRRLPDKQLLQEIEALDRLKAGRPKS